MFGLLKHKIYLLSFLIGALLTCCTALGLRAEVTGNVLLGPDQTSTSTLNISTTVPTGNVLNVQRTEPPPTTPQKLPQEGEATGQYPKLNIEGYKEYEFMKMEKSGDPLQYESDAGYKNASARILSTAGSSGLLRERLRLDIEGKLSEKLSVSYHLEQEPDLPDKFDIRVRYDKTELMFGDFNAQFQTREFINFSKAVNGFQLTSYDDWYDLKLVTAKEKSTAKEVSFTGNGQSTYSLGQTSILEGSVKVYVNSIRLQEDVDYTIDYFEGKITFKNLKSTTDQIRIQYEFTDPVEELIPVATKVDFFGLQGTYKTFEEIRREKMINSVEQSLLVAASPAQMPVVLLGPEPAYSPAQVLPANPARQETISQSVFILEGTPVVFGSEEIYLNGKLLKLNDDYMLDYDRGELKLLKKSVKPSDEFKVKYQYVQNKKLAETFNGKESQGPYALSHAPVLRKTVSVFAGNLLLEEGKDYTFDYQKGEIMFSLPLARAQSATVEYAYIVLKELAPGAKPQEAFSLQTTYLQETADSGKSGDNVTSLADDTNGGVEVSQNGALIILDQTKLPVKDGSISAVIVSGAALPAVSLNIEEFRGYIFVSPSIPVSASVLVAYDYLKTNLMPVQTYSSGGGGMTELILENQGNKYLPVVYHSEEVYRRWYDTSIGLWREDILHRGENYVWGPLQVSTDGSLLQEDKAEYWSRGYITFVTKNIANTWVPWPIPNGEQIKIKYRFAPGEQADFGRITHQVYGVNTQYLINPDWVVGLEAMKSEKTYNLAVIETVWNGTGTGVYGASYQLAPIVAELGVVENTDQVYLNNTLQSRNDDYVINYKKGEVRFKNGKNPGVSDNIQVRYKYYSNTDSSGNTLKQQHPQGTAYKASTAYKTGPFTVASNVLNIEKDFDTIGSMRQEPGTRLGDISVVYSPASTFRLGTFVENKNLFLGVRDNSETWYKNSYFQKHESYWEFLPQQLLEFNFQQTDTIQESQSLTVTANKFDVDTIDRIYGGKLTVGPDYLRSAYEERRTEALGDVLDRKDLLTTVGTFRHFNNFYRPWNILTFTTDYQYDHVDADIHPWYIQTSDRYQETIDYLPLPTWSNKADYSKQVTSKLNQVAPRINTESISELTNYFYGTTLTRPSEWTDSFFTEYYTHFDRNYAQVMNPLGNQAPDTEDKDNFNQSLRPWDLFKLSWDATRFNALKGDELDISDKYTHKTSFEDFRPLKLWGSAPVAQNFFIVERVAYGEGVYNRLNKLSTGSTSGNSTFETNYDYNVGLKMNPSNYTVLNYTYDESNRQTIYDILYGRNSDTTYSDRPQYKRTYGLSYTPGDFVISVPFTNGFALTNTGLWADRLYSSIYDETSHFAPASPTETVTKKNIDNFEDKQELKFNPFPSLALDFKRKDINEYFVQTGTGTRESLGLNHDLHWTNDIPSPIGTFQLFGYFNGDKTIQHAAPSEDVSLDELWGDYDSYFQRLDEKQNYGLGYTPFPQLTLRTSYTNNDIHQEEISGVISSANVLDEEIYINSKIYSAGAIYRPFSGMTFTYDWDLKRFLEGEGERTTITGKYQPFDWLLGHCIFNYEYVHNSGYGLNDIAQMIAQNRQEGYLASTVQKVSNEKMTGSLDLQILSDINSVVIEGTEVVAVWTMIRLVDKMNADNNYSVNALYLKGRIVF